MKRFPRWRWKWSARLAAAAAVLCSAGALAAPAAGDAAAARCSTLLHEWRVADAVALAEAEVKRRGRRPDALWLLATVRFYQARYADALALMDEAQRLAGRPPGPDEKKFRSLVAGVWRHARAYRTVESRHFSLRYDPRKDEVLAGPALMALELAHDAIKADLGFEPAEKVVVEICPSADAFARGSTLPKGDIERSGTIALCKFNRVMITTPRATLHGYRWRDTLCHEYVHYALMKLTRNHTPLWLHEGLAKYHETRWRGPGGRLSPVAGSLLAEAIETGRLISFQQMYPTFAKLTAQEAALAFAQVETMAELMVDRAGEAGVRRMLAALREGRSIDEALRPFGRGGLKGFYARWLKFVKRKKLKRLRGLEADRPRLRARDQGRPSAREELEALQAAASKRAADFVRLGDMLREERRPKAAAQEYEKARRAAGGLIPLVETRLAFARLEARDDAGAARALQRVLTWYPDYQPALALEGLRRLRRGEWEAAIAALREAVEINPFDYVSRARLADAYGRAGQPERKQEQLVAIRLILGPRAGALGGGD